MLAVGYDSGEVHIWDLASEKVVKTIDEMIAEQEQAYFQHLADEEAKEIAYWDAKFAAEQTDTYVDPREDYHDWVILFPIILFFHIPSSFKSGSAFTLSNDISFF